MARRQSCKRSNPPQIHVFAEGESEKLYLSCLQESIGVRGRKKLVIKSKKKQGCHLFNAVKKHYEKHDFTISPVMIVLIVDKDDTPIADLIQLIDLCNRERYMLIYSNECFELWLLLHNQKVTKSMNRADLRNALTKIHGQKYDKTDKSLFEKIVQNYKIALDNSTNFQNTLTANMLNVNPYTNMADAVKSIFNVQYF